MSRRKEKPIGREGCRLLELSRENQVLLFDTTSEPYVKHVVGLFFFIHWVSKPNR